MQNDTNLEKEMKGKFPNKLFNITLTGRALKDINPDILRVCISNELSYRKFSVKIYRSIGKLPFQYLSRYVWIMRLMVSYGNV